MDKKLKAKWIKALRSGSYRQAKGGLIGHGRSYCCLGVLSRLMNPRINRINLDYPPYSTLDASIQRELASMNDAKGDDAHNFKQIANFIKTNL